MNLSISSLFSLRSTSLSPFLVPRSSFLSVQGSAFDRHFSSAVLATHSFSLRRVKFTRTLSSAIEVSSSAFSATRTLYTKTLTTRSADTEFKIVECAFQNCVSGSNGGAIQAAEALPQATFYIEKTGFISCSAAEGGAFTIQTSTLTITSSCFSGCTATNKNSVMKWKGKTFSFSNLYIESSSGKYCIDLNGEKDIKYNKINHTSNKDDKTMIQINCDGDGLCNYLHFNSNECGNALFLRGQGVLTQFVNFYRNRATTLVEAGSYLAFYNIYFILEEAKTFFNPNSYSIKLQDIYFSGTTGQATLKFGTLRILGLNVEYQNTYDLEVSPSSACWVLVSKSGSSFPTYKIFMVIAFVLLLIAVGYFIYRMTRRRYGLSGEKLAYTL